MYCTRDKKKMELVCKLDNWRITWHSDRTIREVSEWPKWCIDEFVETHYVQTGTFECVAGERYTWDDLPNQTIYWEPQPYAITVTNDGWVIYKLPGY